MAITACVLACMFQPPDPVQPAALQVPSLQRPDSRAAAVDLHQVCEFVPGDKNDYPGRPA